MDSSTRKDVLIVEDEKPLVAALRRKITDAGFDVREAYDGQEALLKVAQKKPDLILLDLILPVKDGLSVLRSLKSSEENKNIPVIVLTNLSDDKKVFEVLKAGGSDYLIKVNYSLDLVISKVKERLKNNGQS